MFGLALPLAFVIGFKGHWLPFLIILSIIILVVFPWFKDLNFEDFQGRTSLEEETLIKAGFGLFIVREVMLFFSFFWCFFHSRLSATIILGRQWPPLGVSIIPTFRVPLVNTVLLLLRGVRLTWAHHSLEDNKKTVSLAIWLTILLGFIFLVLQAEEYTSAIFSISDRVYGSIFFLATGFHGAHVMAGGLFLTIVTSIKTLYQKKSLIFIFAAWYWHFVDVVWLFLFIRIYWWGR